MSRINRRILVTLTCFLLGFILTSLILKFCGGEDSSSTSYSVEPLTLRSSIETTWKVETAEEETTEEETTVPVTYQKVVLSTMFTTGRVNVRVGPGFEYEVDDVYDINTEVEVINYDKSSVWSAIFFPNNAVYWIYTEYLSFDRTVVEEEYVKPNYFAYYGVWSNDWWHFTPEEIDNQWAGKRLSKSKLDDGTTRAWQEYLYSKLDERNIAWFYKYAVAMAFQESGMDPLHNINHTEVSWIDGQATYDCGLFNFKDIYWNSDYGSVFDYKANINAYVDRITPFLISGYYSEDELYHAISQHYTGIYTTSINYSYVNDVLEAMNDLWQQ